MGRTQLNPGNTERDRAAGGARVGGVGLMYPQLEEQGEGPVEIILLIHLRVQRAQKNSVLRGGQGTRRAWDDAS